MKKRIYTANKLSSAVFTTTFLILSLLCASVYGNEQDKINNLDSSITITFQKENLQAAVNKIRTRTGIKFAYDPEALQLERYFSPAIEFKETPLNQVLDKLLVPAGIGYREINGTIVLHKLNNAERAASSDSLLNIKGRVFDTNEPPNALPGVNVRLIRNSDTDSDRTVSGVITDLDGNFSIMAGKGDVLMFSMIGYQVNEHLVLKRNQNLTISLKEDVAQLNEVVVVGLTEQEKRHMASSVASLNIESNITGKPITTISQSLQGGVTGLQVTQGSGLPGGDAAAIKIRGISTLGNSDPLVLVDGVPMDMDHIDPVTVESVTVLKDAAAAAIYGARAANGVIVVTTKRGVPGEVSVTYDGYYGFQTPASLPATVDAPTYMRMYNEGEINSGKAAYYPEEEIRATALGLNPVAYPNTNWIDLMVDKQAPITSHSLAVSGGNSVARFAVTGNYIYQKGMIPHSLMERFNIRTNTSITLSDNFMVNLDLLAIKRNTSEPNKRTGAGGNRFLEDIYRVPPTVLPRYPELYGESHYGHYVDIVNPLAYAERGGSKSNEMSQASINLQPKWEIIPNLNLNGQFSFRLNSEAGRIVRDNTNFYDYYTGQLIRTWGTQREPSIARSTYLYMAANADYTIDAGDHYLFALAGYSQEETNSGEWDIYSMLSGYAKMNYSFKDKYLLEGTFRTDGSSKFGPGKKFGFFPSVAVGWNVHNEQFLKGSGVISNLKLRASYGQLGNENIGLYKYQTIISPTHGLEQTYGNPDITWETVTMLDIGADLSLFRNRLDITVDYYDKHTEDIILTPLLPYVGGFQGEVPVNAGEVRNRGWEASLNYYNAINQNISLSVRPGVSYNKNEIISLVGGPYIDNNVIDEVGSSIGSFYGYKSDGLLQESDFDEDGNALVPVLTNGGQQAGDIKYLDINDDGFIDSNDQQNIGNPVANLNYFSNFRVACKKFDLEFLLQGKGKSDAILSDMFALPLNMSEDGGVPTVYYAENYWTPERTDARFPRLSTNPANNKLPSDFWFQNASYLRVKYIQLGYNLNNRRMKQMGIKSARIYANAQNPLTFTSVKLTDPESRGNQWTYGLMKTYTIGVNIQF